MRSVPTRNENLLGVSGLSFWFVGWSNLGLNARALQQALDEGRFAEKVGHDFSGGIRSGVNGTPTFFINGQRHDADFEFDILVEASSFQIGN